MYACLAVALLCWCQLVRCAAALWIGDVTKGSFPQWGPTVQAYLASLPGPWGICGAVLAEHLLSQAGWACGEGYESLGDCISCGQYTLIITTVSFSRLSAESYLPSSTLA